MAKEYIVRETRTITHGESKPNGSGSLTPRRGGKKKQKVTCLRDICGVEVKI